MSVEENKQDWLIELENFKLYTINYNVTGEQSDKKIVMVQGTCNVCWRICRNDMERIFKYGLLCSKCFDSWEDCDYNQRELLQ